MNYPLHCEYCGLGITEWAAWHRGSMYQWMHIGSGLINCAGNMHQAEPMAVASVSSPNDERRLRITPIFAWYDLWVGAFWDKQKRRLYLFPIPCFGIVINFGGKG